MDAEVRATGYTESELAQIERLRRFYAGEGVRIRISQQAPGEVFSPKELLLDAINDIAPEVATGLRDTVLEEFNQAFADGEPLTIQWRHLKGRRFAPLRRKLESWAATWGLERHRWTRDHHWTLDAALRLLSKWHDGINTTEFTLPRPISPDPTASDTHPEAIVRTYRSFVLLVFSHVLERRPWLKGPSTDYEVASTDTWVRGGDIANEDINERIREAAKRVGLSRTKLRKARPGRR